MTTSPQVLDLSGLSESAKLAKINEAVAVHCVGHQPATKSHPVCCTPPVSQADIDRIADANRQLDNDANFQAELKRAKDQHNQL